MTLVCVYFPGRGVEFDGVCFKRGFECRVSDPGSRILSFCPLLGRSVFVE